MDNLKWNDLHCEFDDKELHNRTNYDYAIYINENVDYRVIMDIRQYTDGSRNIEIVDQSLVVYDEDGAIVDSFTVTLPKKYINRAIESGEEYEF